MNWLKWLLAILSLLIFFISSDAVLDPALLPRFILFGLILLLAALMSIQTGAIYIPEGKAGKAIVACLLTLFVINSQSYLINLGRVDAHFLFFRDLSILLLFILLMSIFHQRLLNDQMVWKWLGLMTVIPLVLGLYQIIPLLLTEQLNPETAYGIKAGFAHRNIYAQFLALTIPVHVVNTIRSQKYRFVWGGLLFLQMALISMLMCRSAWLGLGLSVYVISALFILSKISGKRIQIVSALVGVLLPVAIFFLLKNMPTDNSFIGKTIHSLTHWHYGSTGKRLDIWMATLEMIKEKPLFGHGLGSWRIEMLRFISGASITEDNSVFYQRPHNDLLWTWSESGIVAALSKFCLFLIVFVQLIKTLMTNWKWEVVALLMMLLTYFIISMLSFPWERPDLQFLLVIAMALSMQYFVPHFKNLSKRFGNGILAIAIITVLISLFIGFNRIKGEVLSKKAFMEMNRGNWDKADIYLNGAENKFYNMDAVSTPLAWYRGMYHYQAGLYSEAANYFEKSRSINPYHVHSINNLASTYFKLGQYGESKKLYDQILDMDANNNEANFNLGVISFNEGKIELCVQYFQKLDSTDLGSGQKLAISNVLTIYLDQLIDKSKDSTDQTIMTNMQFSDPWMLEILFKSAANDITLENQVELDLIYIKERGIQKVD